MSDEDVAKLNWLADWFEANMEREIFELDKPGEGDEVQRDLRRIAKLYEGLMDDCEDLIAGINVLVSMHESMRGRIKQLESEKLEQRDKRTGFSGAPK